MLIIMQERCDNANGNNNSSIRRVLYKQFEYVLTIIASQGNNIFYWFFFNYKKLICDLFNKKETQSHTNLGQH